MEPLSESFIKLKNLKKLDLCLDYTGIDDIGVQIISNGIAHLVDLQELNLSL